MDFLNVGPGELVVILIIAILVVGPKRMAEIARAIGRVTSQFRKLSNELTATIQAEMEAAELEARESMESVTGSIAQDEARREQDDESS